MKSLVVCLVGLLVFVDASLASSPVISGQVRLPDGSPVASAQVVLFDVADLGRGPVGQTTTDETGQFALPLAAGSAALVLPREVGLGANYPNPFNPSTIIPYQLATTSQVRLEVFNILGQRVATLVDDQQAAGAYRARWDGTDAAGGAAASGVYFYRLTVAGAQWTGKMVLVDGQAGVPLGGASVEAVSPVAGSSARYGLVVAGDGLVAYVDSAFGVAAGQGPVDIELAAGPKGAGKVVPTLEGMLGDVNTDGRVGLDDGLLVAMYGVHPSLSLPNHGLIALGDVNCDGRVGLEDAGFIATFVANPADASVSSRRIGQRGGYSLDPVTEVVWGSILGSEQQDATVAQILDEVPVLLSGVLPIDGQDRLYLGIDRAYWTAQGGKQLYEALKQRFPITPIHVEPSIGVVRPIPRQRPPAPPASPPPPMRLIGPSLSFIESPRSTIEDHTQQQRVVGQITVPDDVTVGTVSVGVEILHPSRGDLKIDLVAPSGVATTLYDGVQTGIHPQANLIDVLPATTALQGQEAQGVWQLRVGDYERQDAGMLQAWELTIIPTSDAEETADPAHIFLDTFEEGLDAWETTSWEARSLDHDAQIPGEGAGNIVAQAKGCSFCFLTLKTPIDLSAHESVTFSFYRWMDEGVGDHEFLGVDIGNNGQYQRLKTWDKRHADGQWHRETFTLSGDQISAATTIRFFAIARNSFTTFAIDNVLMAADPGTIIVTPEPEEEETEEGTPDLAITSVTATPTSVQPGARVTLRATIANVEAPEETRVIRFYRHTTQTGNPRIGGTNIGSRSTLLPTGASRTVSGGTRTPTTPGTYYYYACVNALQGEQDTQNNCSETPATVTVQEEDVQPEVPEPETPEEPEGTPQQYPDLSVTDTIPLPLITIQSDDTLTIQATVTNEGTVPTGATIHVYRHTRTTNNPQRGGVREANTATIDTLDPAKTVSVTSTHRAPTVSAPTQYHYYVCVSAPNEQNTVNNCSPNPATVTVRPKPEDPGPPYRNCFEIPERSTPMGGDALLVLPRRL